MILEIMMIIELAILFHLMMSLHDLHKGIAIYRVLGMLRIKFIFGLICLLTLQAVLLFALDLLL